MAKHIPVPPELQHLVEKRERDRRKSKAAADASKAIERRQKSDRRRQRKSGT
jgi:hypothetical protein